MFHYFEEHGYSAASPYRGIYYIEGRVLFPTQIVVTKELDQAEHIWLRSLSDKLEKQNLVDLLEKANSLKEKADKEYAKSVLEVGFEANKQAVKELIGDERMSEELLEILKPIIEPKMVLREQQGIEKGIAVTIDTLRDFGHPDGEIKAVIIEKYDITAEKADSYLHQ